MEKNIYNPEFVKGLFNRMSKSYERTNYITSFGFSIRWRTQFLKAFPASDEKVEIIDLMTGMGETWQATKHRFPNSNLTVLDFSEGMLKYAKQKSKTRFQDKITILQQDILQNHLPSEHFDYVTCAFGLKTFNAEQIDILAGEIKRILKNGGHLSFIEVSEPNNKVLRFFYGFYLGKVVPLLGKLLLGDPDEYRMLWKYTRQYSNSAGAAKIFADKGFNISYKSYFLGCASGFHGQKVTS